MNYLDLFSGIGGFHLGLEQAGFKFDWVGFSEIDKYATSIYRRHFPDAEELGSIIDIHSNEYINNAVKTWYGEIKTPEEHIMAGKLKKLTVLQVEESIKMYEKGMSLQLIGEYYNVSRQAMWDLLRRRMKLRSNKRFGESNNFYTGTKANDKAQNILEYAIKKGILERPEHCDSCGAAYKFKNGRNAIQAHHCDYNKPLEVVWLCQKCHHEWHKENKAIERNELKGVEGADLVTFGFP